MKTEMKKTITSSLLLLIGMVMLAHAVIPHHYHDKSAACLLTAHRHSDDSDCHQHDDGRIEKCLLKNVYLRPDNNKSLVALSLDDGFQHPALFSINLIAEITIPKALPFRQKPYSLPRHTDHASSSFGLRAPPRI